MNENEIDRIAAMANALRPDWPLASLRSLLAKPMLARRTRRDVAVALAWVACESATKTPARILEAGPWWLATNADGQRTGKASYNQPCPLHADQVQPCPRCKATSVSAEKSQVLQRIRAELASTKANLCPCGVNPQQCQDHDPRRAEIEAAKKRRADAERPEFETDAEEAK
jgi:hypothetical protein